MPRLQPDANLTAANGVEETVKVTDKRRLVLPERPSDFQEPFLRSDSETWLRRTNRSLGAKLGIPMVSLF